MSKKLYTSLFLLFWVISSGYSQLNVTSGASPADIQVCIDSQTVDITLSATGAVTGNSIAINLPPGINYVPSSVTILSNPGGIVITESNISNLEKPSFTFSGAMTVGETCVFQISRTADCRTIAYRDLGNLLLDSVFVTYNTSSVADNLSNINTTVIPFGLNEALVSLGGTGGGGSIVNLQGYPGDVLSRDIIVTNGGLGCVQVIEFYVVDAAAGIQINQMTVTSTTANMGAIPPVLPIFISPHTTNGDTAFYTLDIESLAGTGALLCNGQTITIKEDIEILSCFTDVGDGATSYGVYWDCIARCQNISTTSANVAIPPGVPNIAISDRNLNENPDCFEGQTFTKRFRVSNTGTVDAVNVDFAFEVRNTNSSATQFLAGTSTITTSAGVGPTSIVPTTFGAKKVFYRVDTIPAGTYVDMEIDVEHICPSSCGRYLYDGYRRENINYEDPCGGTYNLGDGNIDGNRDVRGLNPTESNFPAIADGQSRTFTSSFTSISGLNTNSTMFWEFILPPCGVVFNNNPGDIDWGGVSPTSVVVSGDTIRAEFAVSASNIYNNANFNVALTGACGSCGANQNIQKRLLVNTCPSNPNHCLICLYTTTESLVVEQCTSGGGSCSGSSVTAFQFVRTNLGLPDNDNNRLADASGTLDTSLIDRTRFIVSDTAEVLIGATVQINTGSPVFSFAYAEFQIDDNWIFLDASIEVFDASAGSSFTCIGATATSSDAGGKRTFIVDVSPNTLGATCASMSGFVFEDGDSLVVRANIQNTLNGTTIFDGFIYPVDFYTAEVANPTGAQKFTCGTNAFSEVYKVYSIERGFDIRGTGAFTSCNSRRIDLEFEPRTGNNLQNVNIFPFEWRPIGYPDTVRMVMPTGYQYVSARLSSFIGVPNNTAIEPIDASADTLVFVTGDLYRVGGIPANPVQELVPDGIDRSEVQVFIQATCATPDNTNESIEMMVDVVHPLPQLQAFEMLDGTRTENNLRWRKPNIALTNVSTQTAEGTTKNIEWTIRVTNTTNNSDAANMFLSAYVPSSSVVITDIEHIATNGVATGPTTLTKVNNLWQFGDVDRIDFHDFRISATYSQCTADTLIILAGFDCPAYPVSLSAYDSNCELDSLELYTDPKPSTLQLNPIATGTTDDICDTLTYAFTLNSADLANTMNPFLNITLPQGILLLDDPTIEYPLGTAPRAFTVTPVGQTMNIDLAAADAQNPGIYSIATDGIFGIRQAVSANDRQVTITFQFQTDCNFQSGSSFYLQPTGEAPCGGPASGSDITSFEPPILITGLVPPYNVSTNVKISGGSTCSDTVQKISIVMIPDNASTGRDTGYFDLPDHVEYAGNFVCGEGDPTICPSFEGVRNNINGTSTVMVKYPSTWSLGDTIDFSFDVNTAGFTGCSSAELITINHTVTMAGPTCDASGLPCGDVKVIAGQANLSFFVQKPDFTISNLSAFTSVGSSGQIYSVSFDVTNNGLAAPAGMIAEFYCADALGQATGSILHAHTITVPIGSSATVSETTTFGTPASCNNLDGLVVIISQTPSSGSNQCICQNKQSLVQDIPTDLDLPIEWLYFNAEKSTTTSATLAWGTSAEINNLGFEIEHAKPSKGIPVFELIDLVEAEGSSVSTAHYSYQVENMSPGVHYFRLKQIDFDGSFEYSEMRAVMIDEIHQEAKLYPTFIQPNNNTLYLYTPFEDDIVVEMVSMMGQDQQILYKGHVDENNIEQMPFDPTRFTPGYYVIRVRGEKTILVQKVIIVKE
ncbi:MAG: hypothetical protein GY810_19020 [Aureispira sp.]|nr:hypothetical protein [Aureispira sp.]